MPEVIHHHEGESSNTAMTVLMVVVVLLLVGFFLWRFLPAVGTSGEDNRTLDINVSLPGANSEQSTPSGGGTGGQ